MVKALILKGDKTTHGGTVLNGFSDYTIQGIPVAGVGHLVACPLCKGVFPIVQGYGGLTVNGVFVALDGHVTACGAKLIPSQHEEVVDDGGGGVIGAVAQAVLQQEPEQPQQTQYASLSDEQRSMINDGVYRPDQDQGGIAQIAAEEDDNLNPSRFRDETGRETDLSEWSNEQNFNYWRNETKKIVPDYEVMRAPNKPYTQEDVEGARRDYEKARRGELLEQKIQKAEQNRKNNPPLKFENFDKPRYEANQAHNSRSPMYNPNKTPEPPDAEEAYKNARPGKPGQWYSIGKRGIYRYSSTNNGTNHFSGIFSQDRVRRNDKVGAKQLDDLAKELGIKL